MINNRYETKIYRPKRYLITRDGRFIDTFGKKVLVTMTFEKGEYEVHYKYSFLHTTPINSQEIMFETNDIIDIIGKCGKSFIRFAGQGDFKEITREKNTSLICVISQPKYEEWEKGLKYWEHYFIDDKWLSRIDCVKLMWHEKNNVEVNMIFFKDIGGSWRGQRID